MRSMARRTSKRNFLPSSVIDQDLGSSNALGEYRIRNRIRGEQVHFSSKKGLKDIPQIEQFLPALNRVLGVQLNDQIHIAPGFIKARTDGRTEGIQHRHIVGFACRHEFGYIRMDRLPKVHD